MPRRSLRTAVVGEPSVVDAATGQRLTMAEFCGRERQKRVHEMAQAWPGMRETLARWQISQLFGR
jgi:hypothetical protein